jgi:hypothetical protein
MKTKMVHPVLCGRHFRVWENQHGLVAWDDESKSRSAAQLLEIEDELVGFYQAACI